VSEPFTMNVVPCVLCDDAGPVLCRNLPYFHQSEPIEPLSKDTIECDPLIGTLEAAGGRVQGWVELEGPRPGLPQLPVVVLPGAADL
jgi:hypothetical protein